MTLKTNEKIKIILGRRNMTLADLADGINISRQNLSNKMSRNNFSEKELKEIAAALNCSFDVTFVMNDSGESI